MPVITRLPARHVHLDFHTSEHVPDVGSRFSRKQFQKALKLGRVNHITVFAKCHHSWSYYPTSVGMVHPKLKKGLDLMGEQIAACREIGVRVPIYYTVGWSATDAQMHPEWCARNKDGSIAANQFPPDAKPTDRKPMVSWKYLCTNTGYRQLILEQTREICQRYPVDGFFYDICGHEQCYCDPCRADMARDGVNIDDEPAVKKWYVSQWVSFYEACRRVILELHPQASVFFNGRANLTTPADILAQQTHFEMEDLPTTWGGYDKFPPRAKYFATYDTAAGRQPRAMLAMSGKFHTMWGEFGGFKHPDAIRFEAAGMIAYGAACSFGDQMHPNGEMDLATYRNIGQAYQYVEAIEDFGLESRPWANLGVFLTGGRKFGEHGDGTQAHDQGVVNMLMEAQLDFEIAHPHAPAEDWQRYDTIILTGGQCLDAAMAQRFAAYVKAGGSLLVLHQSMLDANAATSLLDIGGKYIGPAEFEIDYTLVGKALSQDLVDSPFLNYTAAARVKSGWGAKVLAAVRLPFFNRTFAHYCSHQNAPYHEKDAAHPAAMQKGRTVYLAHPLGEMYYRHGARVHRQLFLNALRRLYNRPLITAALPSAGRVNLLHQPQHRRYVAHLTYGPPLQRGRCTVIEDLPILRDVEVTIRLPEKIKRAWEPTTGHKLKLSKGSHGTRRIVIPQLHGHAMAALAY
ncbi:MAG: alpha-amylase family protein [Phycisphaeraceae bacterium]